MATRKQKMKALRLVINEWESLDKEAFIFEYLLPLLTKEQIDEIIAHLYEKGNFHDRNILDNVS